MNNNNPISQWINSVNREFWGLVLILAGIFGIYAGIMSGYGWVLLVVVGLVVAAFVALIIDRLRHERRPSRPPTNREIERHNRKLYEESLRERDRQLGKRL